MGFFGSVLPAGCHNSNCKEPGFNEGEQFRITITSPSERQCAVAPLAVGDSFVLTGGAQLLQGDGCHVRGATPQVPSFATTVLTSCRESAFQLGLDCTGMITPACNVSAQLRVGPDIEIGTTAIEGGVFSILWTGSDCLPGGCTDKYGVRIERTTQ